MAAAPIHFKIAGQCYSLKNSRDIFPIKAQQGVKCPYCHHPLRMITVPNQKAKQFDKRFHQQLPEPAKQNLVTAVRADIEIFYPSNLSDLDEALVLDCMQRHGVIENDRQIVAKYVEKRIDPLNPRVEVTVTPVRWERSGNQPGLLDDESQQPDMKAVV